MMQGFVGHLNVEEDGRILSREQKREYAENGYIILKKAIPNSEVKRFLKRFDEICEDKNVSPRMVRMHDVSDIKAGIKPKIYAKIQDFTDDPVLFDYCKNNVLSLVAQDLIGFNGNHSNIIAMHTMYINKPPDKGILTTRHPLHQDQQYFTFGPPDYIIGVWTALEHVNRQNGCLTIVPGSHKLGKLYHHDYPDWANGANKAYHGIVDMDPSWERVHLEMEPGDTIFFHPLLIHGSGANRTNVHRPAISCHYANGDLCRYGMHGGEHSIREITDMLKNKWKFYGKDPNNITLEDLFKTRSRSISGHRSHL